MCNWDKWIGAAMAKDAGVERWLEAWRHIGVQAQAGWDASVQDVDLAADPGPKAFLYLFDLVSRWAWMGTASLAGFHELSAAGKKVSTADLNDIRGGLGTMIAGLADGEMEVSGEREQGLGVLASMYAGGTKTYAAARGFPDRCHFVVIVYRKPGGKDVLLRPFAMDSGPNRPVDADVLEAMLQQVIDMDRINHPEWFKGKDNDE